MGLASTKLHVVVLTGPQHGPEQQFNSPEVKVLIRIHADLYGVLTLTSLFFSFAFLPVCPQSPLCY